MSTTIVGNGNNGLALLIQFALGQSPCLVTQDQLKELAGVRGAYLQREEGNHEVIVSVTIPDPNNEDRRLEFRDKAGN